MRTGSGRLTAEHLLDIDDGRHRPRRPPVRLGSDDELLGLDVLPGFRCSLSDLFRPLD